MLNNLAALLDRNSEFSEEGEDTVTENEERLFDVPIMMLTDINQQVSGNPGSIPLCETLPVLSALSKYIF